MNATCCADEHPALVQTQRDVIFELRRIAFDGENDPTGTEKRKAMYTKDYKMLGFTVSPFNIQISFLFFFLAVTHYHI